jgi:peptide/nickel transport system substrate-binding protein
MSKYLLASLLIVVLFLSSCDTNPTSDKKYFRYNQSSGITSLDPAFSKDQATIWVCNQLYNSLVQLDDNLNTQPALAKSWTISEDGLTYTFNLRQDVFFHDDTCFEGGKGRRMRSEEHTSELQSPMWF